MLLVIFMAAATGDDEDAQRLDDGVRSLGEKEGRSDGEGEQRKEESNGWVVGWKREC